MKVIIIILQAILNLVRKRRDLIANRSKIPPEYRDDVVVWYSPKKQRLTNYDVIEAYVEDFTIWGKKPERATITTTNKTINITNVKKPLLSIIEDNRIPFSDLVVEVTGVSEETYLTVRSGNLITQTIKTDGVYKISTNNKYLAFGVSKVGDCNITITQLPTSILKDLSGNGNHAYLYGGKGKLNSGMGLYKVDFTTYSKTSVVANVSHNTVKVVPAANNYLFVRYARTEMPAYTVNVQNLGNNVLTYQYATENGRREITLTEGINEIPESIKTENPYQVGFYVSAGTGEITITQIPDYPDQLCYDGKMYAVCYDFPILTDYTVMADRTWFDKTGVRCFCSKYKDSTVAGLFRFKWVAGNKEYTSSLGKDANVVFVDSNITWQTKTSYNGKALTNLQYEDGEHLIIGDYAEKIGNYYIGCHDDIIILKRSLTINEIDDICQAVFNESIIQPVFDLKATDVVDAVNNGGGKLIKYTDAYGIDYIFNNFTLGDAVGNKDYPNALYFAPNKQVIRFAPDKIIKTVIIDGIFDTTCLVYDSRNNEHSTNFALYTGNIIENHIAWNARANSAKTYINGELNTTIKGTELYGVRHIAAMTKNASSTKENNYINGANPAYNNKLIIYRITGFDVELTPNQIKNWYKRNKPE